MLERKVLSKTPGRGYAKQCPRCFRFDLNWCLNLCVQSLEQELDQAEEEAEAASASPTVSTPPHSASRQDSESGLETWIKHDRYVAASRSCLLTNWNQSVDLGNLW